MNYFKSPIVVFCFVFLVCFETSAQKLHFSKNDYLAAVKSNFKTNQQPQSPNIYPQKFKATGSNSETTVTIQNIIIDQNADSGFSTDLLKLRLQEMDAKSPFKIEYSLQLENVIKSFLKTRKKSFERLMSLSEFYFPIFEEALLKNNIPIEIKYLAIVESALNPKAISKMGASGLWQFMHQTGKEYHLTIDSFVDERNDPVRASYAAAAYMKNMYKIFGDWSLVLAAYNSGAGNVSKALKHASNNQDFRSVSAFLPKETQDYLPLFLATMYIFEYHKAHGIMPQKAIVKHFETDTVGIKQRISFHEISDLLDIPVLELASLNPFYKKNIVPLNKNKKQYLRLPSEKARTFLANETKIYDYVLNSSKGYASLLAFLKTEKSLDIKTDSIYKKHLVGAHLILKKKQINLQIEAKNSAVDQPKKYSQTKYSENLSTSDKLDLHNTTPIDYELYMVQKDENLRLIAKKFEVTEADLQLWNHLEDTKIEINTKLKIMHNREISQSNNNTTIQHIVQTNETIYTIAKIYMIFSSDIRKWNKRTSNDICVGESLKILKTDKINFSGKVASQFSDNKSQLTVPKQKVEVIGILAKN